MQNSHVVIAKNTPQRWYDNPDISDLMFASFSFGRQADGYLAQCLHLYDKSTKKGLNKFVLENGKLVAKEIVKSLKDRIVYHPILTLSTINKDFIKASLENILDGIDGVNGDNGLPSVILIPILLGKDHFGTVAIKPPQESQKAEVYYFNSLGVHNELYDDDLDYWDEEQIIFNVLANRYDIKSTDIKHNGKERWQTDTSQCGPYIVWFAQKIKEFIINNQFTSEKMDEFLNNRYRTGAPKVFANDAKQENINRWHNAYSNQAKEILRISKKLENIDGINDDDVKALHSTWHDNAVNMRKEQADLLVDLNTNFSTNLFIDYKLKVLNTRSLNYMSCKGPKSFTHHQSNHAYRSLKEVANKAGTEFVTVGDVDCFEVQYETKERLIEAAKELGGVVVRPRKEGKFTITREVEPRENHEGQGVSKEILTVTKNHKDKVFEVVNPVTPPVYNNYVNNHSHKVIEQKSIFYSKSFGAMAGIICAFAPGILNNNRPAYLFSSHLFTSNPIMSDYKANIIANVIIGAATGLVIAKLLESTMSSKPKSR